MREEGHMWARGGLARSSAEGQQTGETREIKVGKTLKSLWSTFHFEIKSLLRFFLIERVHFQARVFVSPGGILCSSPHPVFLKASFQSAKWHANGSLLVSVQILFALLSVLHPRAVTYTADTEINGYLTFKYCVCFGHRYASTSTTKSLKNGQLQNLHTEYSLFSLDTPKNQ